MSRPGGTRDSLDLCNAHDRGDGTFVYFYVDDSGVSHLQFDASSGTGTSEVTYRLVDPVLDCWEFTFVADITSSTQVVEIYCC